MLSKAVSVGNFTDSLSQNVGNKLQTANLLRIASQKSEYHTYDAAET